jgi:hypothetical protein
MATWTFKQKSLYSGKPITAVVSAENAQLALALLRGELLEANIYDDVTTCVEDLIPLPTQTRKVRILSNGE